MATPAPPSTDAARRTKVFVSYAHEDRPRTRQLVHALEQAGFEVWWDGLIVAGAQFANETERALEAAAAVVVLWSCHSVGSHWVRDEAAVGRDRSRLVPVSLDGTEPPLGFRQYLFIDLSKWQGKAGAPEIRAIVSAMQQTIGAKVPAQPVQPGIPPARTSRRGVLLAGGGLVLAAASGAGWFVTPAASVSGLYLGHPEADYFAIGRVDAEQMADYARRAGRSLADVEAALRGTVAD